MAKLSTKPVKGSRLNDHDTDCPHHGASRVGLCTALTVAGQQCSRRAKATDQTFPPLCGMHQHQSRRAGNCQAVEECGQLCNRLALYDAPYHLCKKHQKGTDTLPCHLIRLPTELRLMIFRYLFPEIVSSYKKSAINVAILKVNRQIYQEASLVLYDESIFEAFIEPKHIKILGKTWYRQPFVKNETDDYTMEQSLCHAAARRIRNLNIDVSLVKSKCPKGVSTRGITHEEQELYMMRDSVRKLVKFMSTSSDSSLIGQNAIRRLKVRPILEMNWNWKKEEAVYALFLIIEPFQLLPQVAHPVLEAPTLPSWCNHSTARTLIANMQKTKIYNKLREQWYTAIQASASAPHFTVDAAVEKGYRRIERFVQLLYLQDASTSRAWTTTIFHGIERPLHLARVAYENNDSDTMDRIHEAIMVRWVNAHRQRQGSLRAIADSINAMFEKDRTEDESASPQELYPDAFLFEEIEPIKESVSRTYLWLELNTEDDAPKIGDPGVVVKKKGLRVQLEKGDTKWLRLMMPAMVRQIQENKEAASKA